MMNEYIDILMEKVKFIKYIKSPFEQHMIFIYGAGNFGKEVFRALARKGITVHAFIDRNAHPNTQWNDLTIYSPDDSRLSNETRKNSLLILALHNRDVDLQPIRINLINLGYQNIILPIELYDYVGRELGDRFWLTSRQAYLQWRDEIVEGSRLWGDATI